MDFYFEENDSRQDLSLKPDIFFERAADILKERNGFYLDPYSDGILNKNDLAVLIEVLELHASYSGFVKFLKYAFERDIAVIWTGD